MEKCNHQFNLVKTYQRSILSTGANMENIALIICERCGLVKEQILSAPKE